MNESLFDLELANLPSQKTVSAYFTSKQMLHFGFAVADLWWRISGYLTVHINTLTAGAEYIGVIIFYQHIKYLLLNMLKIKRDINQQDF